jgi:hypothetical protein
MRPNTAWASVFPWTWGIPQSSRVMVTAWACSAQRAASGFAACRVRQAAEASPRARRMFFMVNPSCVDQGAPGGGTRRFVICSKAYPSSMRRGSLHALPVKLMPNG